MKRNSFLQGTIVASVAIIITKILGMLYVIPFYKIIGKEGGVLYSYAYQIYNLFLNISTAGIPIAISMVISEFNTKKMYEAKERTFKLSKRLIGIIAVIAFLVLFIFADGVALFFIKGIEGASARKDIILVVRSISICLLIAPFLSCLRGYLQGHKFITATSISQVIEQLIRIFVILIGSYLTMKFTNDMPLAVAISLTGAFFGGLLAYFYLKFKVNRNKSLFEKAKQADTISNKEIINKIIKYSIPLIITSVVANLYDIIDAKLIIKGLYMINYKAADAELISSIIVTWGPKICMVMSAIAMGLATSLIPHLVNSFTKNDLKDVNFKFNQALITIIGITVPMALGISFLAKPIYTIFYGYNKYGHLLLQYIAILTIVTSFLAVINTTLQGLKKFKLIYINSIVGLAVSAILDIPLILLFNKIGIFPYYGTVTATIIGCITSFMIVFKKLNKDFKFNYKPTFEVIRKMIIPSIAMIAILFLTTLVVPMQSNSKLKLLLYTVIYIVPGAAVYLIISYFNKGLYCIFGEEFIDSKLKKLKLKK